MLELTSGNLLEADAEALVNTVNCVGVMGKGIALQFKQVFPDNTRLYERACRAEEVVPGRMLVFSTGKMVNPKFIINFPTKKHWKGKSTTAFIRAGLDSLIQEIARLGINSIALPPLGCGNGGLDWSDVYPIIRDKLCSLPVRVLIYAPSSSPMAMAMPVGTERPTMTRARALLVKLMERYGQPGYRLSLLEIQKLAYFLQESGELLKLKFEKEKYGPYAENLNFVLQKIEGHFIRGYGDRTTRAEISLVPGCVKDANKVFENDAEAIARLERVSKLIEGFETPHGLELLATVHWVARHDATLAVDENFAIAKVHSWSARKAKAFPPEQIRTAWRTLMRSGYLAQRSGADGT